MDSSANHYQTLSDRHHALDKSIAEEMKRPAPDEIALHEMKKQKLALKEQMEQLNPA